MASMKKVKESLIEQLAVRGMEQDFFSDMIKDYMNLWSVKNKLIADIKNRGINYKDVSSTGIPMWKSNPSVKELVLVNRQMLSMLKELRITTDVIDPGSDNDL
jgi:hypothetical protein